VCERPCACLRICVVYVVYKCVRVCAGAVRDHIACVCLCCVRMCLGACCVGMPDRARYSVMRAF